MEPQAVPLEPTPYSLRWVFQDYLLDNPGMPPPIREVVESIMSEALGHDGVAEILNRHGIPREHLRTQLLDLVLYYGEFALVDHALSPDETATIRRLKLLLAIKEGEFWDLRRNAVARLVWLAIERILEDRTVSFAEELHQVELQSLFDLGYDQFLELVREAVQQIHDRLREVSPSDAADLLKAVRQWNPLVDPETRPRIDGASRVPPGRIISQEVKLKVYLRDQGKCAKCGSTENLHFDHIIPYSWGGANDYANIQLLCQECNLKKGASLDS